MSFSKTLDFMLKSGEGYRNTYCRSMYTNLSDIVKYETMELYNIDIFDFMYRNYNNYDLFLIHDTLSQVQYTLQFIAKLLDTEIDNLKGVWLTTHQNVLDKYCYDEDESEFNNIIKVNIHEKKMIPISDLDEYGALFAYVEDTNKESKNEMKTKIFPIKNWSNIISGGDCIIYNKKKYPIGIGYDENKKSVKFVILKPEALNDYEVYEDAYYSVELDCDNYLDIGVGSAEFNIVDIYGENYNENRDFFTDDIRSIRDYYANKFGRKFTNKYIYILKDNYHVPLSEFGRDAEKITGIFIKKICKNLSDYLRAINYVYDVEELKASEYNAKSHKYFSDVFIGLRVSYDTALEELFAERGFVSINDYTGFENSHGFVFINPTSNKELIYFYKMLYNDMRTKYNNP